MKEGDENVCENKERQKEKGADILKQSTRKKERQREKKTIKNQHRTNTKPTKRTREAKKKIKS